MLKIGLEILLVGVTVSVLTGCGANKPAPKNDNNRALYQKNLAEKADRELDKELEKLKNE